MPKLSPDLVYTALIIFFGAVVHATTQFQLARQSKSEFTWVDFAVLTVVAGFAGLMSGLLATVFMDSQTIIYVAAGIGGFLGVNGLNVIANTFLEFLTAKIKK